MKTFEDEFDEIPEPEHLPAKREVKTLDDEDEYTPSEEFMARWDLVVRPPDYQFEPFIPVQEVTDDIKTTESDLNILNNSMAILSNAMTGIRSVDSAIKIANTMAKLIEVRRKVKKLPYGASTDTKPSRGYEVLE